jgi:hypothetical protein
VSSQLTVQHLSYTLMARVALLLLTAFSFMHGLCTQGHQQNLYQLWQQCCCCLLDVFDALCSAAACDRVLPCALHDCDNCRHIACAEGAYSVAHWLLDVGVDPNPHDRHNRTPLEVINATGAAARAARLSCTVLRGRGDIDSKEVCSCQ